MQHWLLAGATSRQHKLTTLRSPSHNSDDVHARQESGSQMYAHTWGCRPTVHGSVSRLKERKNNYFHYLLFRVNVSEHLPTLCRLQENNNRKLLLVTTLWLSVERHPSNEDIHVSLHKASLQKDARDKKLWHFKWSGNPYFRKSTYLLHEDIADLHCCKDLIFLHRFCNSRQCFEINGLEIRGALRVYVLEQ